MMLIFPNNEHGCASTYLCFIQFLPPVAYNFPSTYLLHPWLGLFLGTFFFLKQL